MEDVFVTNGFKGEKEQEYMEESKRRDDKEQAKEQECRGMLVVPCVTGAVSTP